MLADDRHAADILKRESAQVVGEAIAGIFKLALAGTAVKLWSKRPWANVSTYAKLIALLALAVSDPILMEHFGYRNHPVPNTARQWMDRALEQGEHILR